MVIDLKTKNRTAKTVLFFLFSDDLMDLNIEGVV